jgi:tRNA (guanine-N7-)-methyltransferase
MRSFSIRKRGPLSANKNRLLDEVLPRFLFKGIEGINRPISLEVGFGDGVNLFNLAQSNPREIFIGAEPYKSGITKLLSKVEESCLENIVIWPQDVCLLLNHMPESALKRVYILFPDPWPKKRHKKRRLLNEDFLRLIHSKLITQGELYFASDSSDYCKQVESSMLNGSWKGGACDPYSGYTPTKYHQKATSAVSFLCYKKGP